MPKRPLKNSRPGSPLPLFRHCHIALSSLLWRWMLLTPELEQRYHNELKVHQCTWYSHHLSRSECSWRPGSRWRLDHLCSTRHLLRHQATGLYSFRVLSFLSQQLRRPASSSWVPSQDRQRRPSTLIRNWASVRAVWRNKVLPLGPVSCPGWRMLPIFLCHSSELLDRDQRGRFLTQTIRLQRVKCCWVKCCWGFFSI